MGRGSSKLSVADIKKLQKDLSVAKRNETRLRGKYLSAAGATNIDMDKPGALNQKALLIETANKAYERYRQATEERERIEIKLNRAATRRNGGGPMF